jgi:membrane dipeptidase
MLIVDGHLDLAYSALNFGRNLSLPLDAARASDRPNSNGTITVTIPTLIEGQVGIVFGTIYVMPERWRQRFPDIYLTYNDALPQLERQQAAHQMAMDQVDYYYRLADRDERVMLLHTWAHVQEAIDSFVTDVPRVGILLHMEGADPIRDVGELDMWYARGLRSIGLAWDDTRYAPGQFQGEGRLPLDGFRLLERMTEFNMLLDLTHMSEAATFDALDAYTGPIAITHTTARALVPHKRLASDRQMRLIAERDGVIGLNLLNVFLRKEHALGDRREAVPLDTVVAHIDHICQLLGSAEYVALGTDLDGGFGMENTPQGIDSSADLHKIATALAAFGYDETSIEKIMSGNWLRLLRRVLV